MKSSYLSYVVAVTSLYPSASTFANTAETDEPEASQRKWDEMVIIGSYQAKPASIVGSAVSVLTEEEIKKQKTLIATDLLRELPGIAVSRNGSAGSMTQVRIRGAEANHTKVFIDGIDVNSPNNGEFGFENLMSFNIGQIDVLRGPQSALYGSDAIGGVINIQTPTIKENGLISRTEVMAGSMNTKQAGIAVTGKSDRVSGHFSASRYLTDGISASALPDNNEKDGYSNTSFHGKLGFDLTQNISALFIAHHTSSHGNYDKMDDNFIDIIDGNEQNSIVNIYGLAEINVRLLNDMWLQTLAYQTADSTRDNVSDGNYTFGSRGINQRIHYKNSFTLDSFDFNHALTLATEFQRIKYTSFSPTGSAKQKQGENHTNTETGIIGEYTLTHRNGSSLSLSARRDLNNRFNDATTYRATGSLFIVQNIRLHASYGKGVANPTFYELDFSNAAINETGLVPEHSIGHDVGIEFALYDRAILTDITYFNATLKDEISYTFSTETYYNQKGKSTRNGVEFTLKAEIRPSWNLSAMYTYLDAKSPDDKAEIRRPMHTASLTNNYAFLKNKANINIGVIYNGAQWDRNNVQLNDYTLFNAAVSYDITQSLQLFVRAENLFNEQYTEIKGYRSTGVAAFMGFRLKL